MSPTVTAAPMPISSTQLLYESKKAKGHFRVWIFALMKAFQITKSMEKL